MNRRIAVRMLKDAHDNVGIISGFVCNTLKFRYNSLWRNNDNLSSKTKHEYEVTRDNLLAWIKTQLGTQDTLENYLFSELKMDYDNIDMSSLCKIWISNMIKEIQSGKKLGCNSIALSLTMISKSV